MNKLAFLDDIHYDHWMYIGVLSDDFVRVELDSLIFNLISKLVLVK